MKRPNLQKNTKIHIQKVCRHTPTQNLSAESPALACVVCASQRRILNPEKSVSLRTLYRSWMTWVSWVGICLASCAGPHPETRPEPVIFEVTNSTGHALHYRHFDMRIVQEDRQLASVVDLCTCDCAHARECAFYEHCTAGTEVLKPLERRTFTWDGVAWGESTMLQLEDSTGRTYVQPCRYAKKIEDTRLELSLTYASRTQVSEFDVNLHELVEPVELVTPFDFPSVAPIQITIGTNP